jgi:hypothetical protein
MIGGLFERFCYAVAVALFRQVLVAGQYDALSAFDPSTKRR